jgi:hypothetical protein
MDGSALFEAIKRRTAVCVAIFDPNASARANSMAIRDQSHERFTSIGYKLLALSAALATKSKTEAIAEPSEVE